MRASRYMLAAVYCGLAVLLQEAVAQNVIGFAFPEYRVDEDQGEVRIAVQLMQIGQPDGLGNLASRIMTRISTVDIGSASPSSDYTPRFDVMLTFTVGTALNSVQSALISITDDSIVEGEERFRVELEESDPGLGDSSNFVINPSASTTDVIIVDNDVQIGLEVPVTDVNEGNPFEVCIRLISGTIGASSFSIDYTTQNGAAIAPGDYIPTSGTVVISSTNDRQCFPVQTNTDGINEDRECLSVQISTPDPARVSLSPSTTTACIQDVDNVVVQPQFSRIDVNEGDGSVTVCAQASNVINPPVTVNYETRSGSPGAQGGMDYRDASGTFTFTGNELRCVNIEIFEDNEVESEECFTVFLSNGADVVITQMDIEVCIQDNERTFGFAPSSYTVDENATPGTFQVCVRLLAGQIRPGETIQIDLTLTQGVALGGTAEVGVDFQQLDPNPSPLIFDNANQNQALCRVVIILNDLIFEGNEAFYAIISNPNSIAGVTLDPGMARITILEDDLPPEMPDPPGPSGGDDPHFAIFLSSGKLLCYTVQGEHNFAFNLISNEHMQMNALFVPDSVREEVTWIGSLGVIVQNTHFQGSNVTRLQFDAKVNLIHINGKVTLEAKNIDEITFRNGKLIISEGPIVDGFHYPSVRVNLQDQGMVFTVNFTGEHLDMMWNKLKGNQHSHGLIGQFFRKGVEIDVARKLLLLPNKPPVPVMRKPVWAYMEHNVRSDQLCWVAMNPGYQGNHLIDGHYLDYVVDNILSTDFKFECKHK